MGTLHHRLFFMLKRPTPILHKVAVVLIVAIIPVAGDVVTIKDHLIVSYVYKWHYATYVSKYFILNATQALAYSYEVLAKAFHAQCHVNTNTPNWHVDSGATDHMTPACDSLHHSSPYPGNAKVMFGNGKTLPITHTGSTTVSHDIPLRNVLVFLT
ncbi:hypothetical protein Tco_0257148 [Tanacetum coccineum]